MPTLAVSLALIVASLLATPVRAADPSERNVVIVILDDVGVELIGAYGTQEHTNHQLAPEQQVTPNIDRIASQGVLFRNAWSAPVCTPARAALMTGQYGFRSFVGGNHPLSALHPSGATRSDGSGAQAAYDSLPQRLAAIPLRRAIGKWHMTPYHPTGSGSPWGTADPYGFQPIEIGFTRYQGPWEAYPNPGNLYAGSYTNWDEAIEQVASPPQPPSVTTRTQHATQRELNLAKAFGIEAGQNRWLLWLAANAAHAVPDWSFPPSYPYPYDPVSICNASAAPVRCMTLAHLDAMIGELYDLLDEINGGAVDGLLDDTTIILVGDNGSDDCDQQGPDCPPDTAVNRDQKGSLYEGGINVPLIVAGDAVPASSRGQTSEALVHATDVYKTVVELAAGSAPGQDVVVDGHSFVPALEDPSAAGVSDGLRSCVYTDGQFQAGELPRTAHAVAVRDATYKLIRYAAGSSPLYEFFDLQADPGESESKWADVSNPADPRHETYQRLKWELDQASPCAPSNACGLGPEVLGLVAVLAACRRGLRREAP